MKTNQQKAKKRKLLISKKVVIQLTYHQSQEVVGGKTTGIPTCVSNAGCIK